MSGGRWNAPCSTPIGGMPAKAGRARKPACGWRAGAASGGSFCCAVNWPAMWRSPYDQPRPTAAPLWRDRAGRERLAVCRFGHFAGQRDPDARPVVWRSGRLRKRVRRIEEPMGWGGFTTQDLTRGRLFAGMVALIYNWWSLFARLADPEHHREAIT